MNPDNTNAEHQDKEATNMLKHEIKFMISKL